MITTVSTLPYDPAEYDRPVVTRLYSCSAYPRTLTEAQWCAVVDALNGFYLIAEHVDAAADPVRTAWINIEDFDGLGEKWNVDAAALARQVRDMSYPQQAALCDVVRRFWKHPKLNDLDPADLLRACGARLAG